MKARPCGPDLDINTFDEIKGDADSFAGLILEMTGQIPRKGTETHYEGYGFRIEDVDKRRIKKIKITLPKDN